MHGSKKIWVIRKISDLLLKHLKMEQWALRLLQTLIGKIGVQHMELNYLHRKEELKELARTL